MKIAQEKHFGGTCSSLDWLPPLARLWSSRRVVWRYATHTVKTDPAEHFRPNDWTRFYRDRFYLLSLHKKDEPNLAVQSVS